MLAVVIGYRVRLKARPAVTLEASPSTSSLVSDRTSITNSPLDLSHSRLAITLGDPSGIGPELVLKLFADPELARYDLTVVGSTAILHATYDRLAAQGVTGLARPDEIPALDLPCAADGDPGRGTPDSGAASFEWLQTAIAETLVGRFQGIVTAPIAKALWKAAGREFPGQTEVLARATGVERFGMLFAARSPHTGWQLRVLLATTHIPLRDVPQVLTPQLMAGKLDLLVETLASDFGISTPRIAVSGLNPHSGEQGQLGIEEHDWLVPWCERERAARPHVDLVGPVPPDTLWVAPGRAWYGGSTRPADAYLALYHDQGLIPVKLLAFDRAVNTTIGLPFVRTSPDHGTAFDIAGRGIADPTSLKAAVELAAELVARRAAVAAPVS